MANKNITYDPTTTKYLVKYDDKTIVTTVTTKATITEQWVNKTLSDHANHRTVMVGLDVEWRPHPVPSMSNKSATLQLCIDTRCLILQLFYMDEIPQSLNRFLLNLKFTFVGVEVEGDIMKLKNEYGLDCGKSADIRAATIKKWPMMYGRKPGLKHIARDVAGLYMEKPMNVCKSKCDSRVLSEEQVEYACIDAYASYKVAHKLFIEG